MDIVDYIGDFVSLKKAGSRFRGLCPFHQEKTPSFTVYPDRQIFKCYGCGQGGDVFTFLQLREKVSFLEAREILARRAGIDIQIPSGRGDRSGPSRSKLYSANEWARDQFRKWLEDPTVGKEAREYLERRELNSETVEAFGLGFAPASWDGLLQAGGKVGWSPELLAGAGLVRRRSQGGGHRDTFFNRLMFPIVEATGRVIGFGGRTLGDDRAKYLNTPETAIFDKGRNLYGLQQARKAIDEGGRVIVVEGYTDCMMAHQHGFTETVATLGTALTPEQVRLLRRYASSAFLVFDSDEAGTRAADRGLEIFLTQQMDVRLVQVPEGKDPCDFLLARGALAFEDLLNEAIGALEFKWRLVRNRYGGAGTGRDRREAIEEFLQLIATSAVYGAIDPIQRGLVLNELGRLLAVRTEELHRHLAHAGRRIAARKSSKSQEASGDADGPVPLTTFGAEQRALREILEVLLNEPGYYEQACESFDAERFEDPVLRAVGKTVSEMAQEFGEFDVGEVIVRLEEPEYARVITDLHHAGQARQNYARTIESACRRIQDLRLEAESLQAARRLLDRDNKLTEEDEEDLLKSVVDRASQRKGPLPLRLAQGRISSDPA